MKKTTYNKGTWHKVSRTFYYVDGVHGRIINSILYPQDSTIEDIIEDLKEEFKRDHEEMYRLDYKEPNGKVLTPHEYDIAHSEMRYDHLIRIETPVDYIKINSIDGQKINQIIRLS